MRKKKATKVNGKLAAVVIAATLVLAVLIVLLFLLEGGPNPPADQTESTQTDPVQTGPVQTTPEETTPVQTQPPIEIPDMAQGSYEQWLAAASMMVSVLEYPDMSDVTAYFLSETPVSSPMSSQGLYLQLTSGGETVVIRVYPLEQRRTEQGSKDVYSMQTGFATFDVVEDAQLSGLNAVTMEELSVYLDQIMLPSLYEN